MMWPCPTTAPPFITDRPIQHIYTFLHFRHLQDLRYISLRPLFELFFPAMDPRPSHVTLDAGPSRQSPSKYDVGRRATPMWIAGSIIDLRPGIN